MKIKQKFKKFNKKHGRYMDIFVWKLSKKDFFYFLRILFLAKN